jgi:hypothetical protein
MQQWGESVNQKMETIAQYEDERTATTFFTRCPDFPGTEEAIAALDNIVRTHNWQPTPENLQAAHALAVQNRVYQPLSAAEIRQTMGAEPPARIAPPPMLRGNSPDVMSPPLDPRNMPIDQLRREAIKQELERSGARY